MSRKLTSIIRQDGLSFTLLRTWAYGISRLPFALGTHCSFRFYKNSRLIFAPAGLTYSLFAGRKQVAEHGEFNLLQTYVTPGSIVCDVGANIGSHTIVAATLTGPQGHVYTFEPSPRFVSIIQKNIACNRFGDRITLFPVAVGDSETTVFLNEAVADDSTNHISTTGTPVAQRRLDDCLPPHLTTIDFLKIDVEGYEESALAGATQTLTKTKVIYIEFITDPSLPQCLKHPQTVIDTLTKHFDLYQYHWATATLQPFTYDPAIPYSINLVGLKK